MNPIDDPTARHALPSLQDGLSRARPSEAGVDADRLVALLDDIDAAGLDIHGLMLHRDGQVVAEGWRWPYGPSRPRVLHSVAKSFTACAIGCAIDEGLLTLNDKVVSFFPEHLPKDVSPWLAAMTLEDLLTMRTGQASNTSGAVWRAVKTSWIAEFFKIPLLHAPGTHYVYTSAASYMLSAILSRVTGQTMHDYLRPRLFAPLGIQGETWDVGPDGVNPGGNGLTARTVDMLKLGILHAQSGMWAGQRVLPAEWVEAATRPQGIAPSRYGYHWAIRPREAFSAVGVFVQLCSVFPAHGATLAIIGAMKASSEILPHVERHIVPALTTRNPDGPAADARLARRLEAMQVMPVLTSAPGLAGMPAMGGGVSSSPPPSHSPRSIRRRFCMASNAAAVQTLQFDFTADQVAVTLQDDAGQHGIVVGLNQWIESRTDMPGRDLHHGYDLPDAVVVAGARWVDEKTLEMTWIFVETAFKDTVRCVFEENRLRFSRHVNVNSGRLAHDDLHGILVSD